MYDIEEVGLVKMDFLGIRNLSILGQSVEIVTTTYGIKIDLSKIPFDDKKAFELMSKGETIGLFQLGGTGMTRYLKELKPTNIFDIMAMISLFRPGPMNSIPEFIERKHNPKKVKYFDPRMAAYLDQSYGVIVYQDDVLLTAINIAGYTWEEADKFRKAMGKKIPAEMTRQKEKFIEGCIANDMPGEKAEELFKQIETFAAYGFNKAHAASYAVIAYQTAYMKANYPVEFMTAVMTAESDDPDKIAAAVAECERMKILVLPPNINFSQTGFTIEKVGDKQRIRFGFSAIKNVGKAAIEAILSERQEKDIFKSLNNFVKRVNLRVVNRKTLESLIKAGAMDQFGKRNAMLSVLDEIKSSGISVSKTIAKGQGSLFDAAQLEKHASATSSIDSILHSVQEAPKEEILSWERELLGFYLTEHPLTKYQSKISQITDSKIAELDLITFNESSVKICGIIASVRKTLTKVRKEEMCFAKLQDTTGSIEIIVFPRVYLQAKRSLLPDQIVVVCGKLETTEQMPILIAENILSLEEALKKLSESRQVLEVAIPKNADRVLLSKIYQVLKENPGESQTFLILPGENGKSRRFTVPFAVGKSSILESDLDALGCKIL
jgi:DNA polymerase-3 subunit alpha